VYAWLSTANKHSQPKDTEASMIEVKYSVTKVGAGIQISKMEVRCGCEMTSLK
jgi:hypothetical protein